MENPIPLITSFRDYIPSCVHGFKIDQVCEECRVSRRSELESMDEFSRIREEKEITEKEQAKQERLLYPERFMYFLPLKFRNFSFETFKGSDEIKKILLKYSDSFVRDIQYINGRSLFDSGLLQYPGSVLFLGKTGCGKTHLAISIVRELIKRNAIHDVCFITAPELLLEIRATFKPSARKFNDSGQCEADTESDVLDKYSNCELLVLDDLGAEKVSDFTIQSLYLVIDRRNRNLKPTLVTTNLSLEEIETLIDARMASRLADMKVIKLNLPDYRKLR